MVDSNWVIFESVDLYLTISLLESWFLSMKCPHTDSDAHSSKGYILYLLPDGLWLLRRNYRHGGPGRWQRHCDHTVSSNICLSSNPSTCTRDETQQPEKSSSSSGWSFLILIKMRMMWNVLLLLTWCWNPSSRWSPGVCPRRAALTGCSPRDPSTLSMVWVHTPHKTGGAQGLWNPQPLRVRFCSPSRDRGLLCEPDKVGFAFEFCPAGWTEKVH